MDEYEKLVELRSRAKSERMAAEEDSLDALIRELLRNEVRAVTQEFRAQRPTIAPSTAPVDTKAGASDAQEQASTVGLIPSFSQQVQTGTETGPVARCSEFVDGRHQPFGAVYMNQGRVTGKCKCGALLSAEWIAVPDVSATASTSQKPDLEKSVEM